MRLKGHLGLWLVTLAGLLLGADLPGWLLWSPLALVVGLTVYCAARLPRLHLPHPRRADQLAGGEAERRLQFAVDLARDGGEEPDAQHQEDGREGARVPRREAEPQAAQRVHQAPNR